MKSRKVVIDYTNWRGVRRYRTVTPISIAFTHTEHHPKDQWLMLAHDEEKKERRWFALEMVHGWEAD